MRNPYVFPNEIVRPLVGGHGSRGKRYGAPRNITCFRHRLQGLIPGNACHGFRHSLRHPSTANFYGNIAHVRCERLQMKVPHTCFVRVVLSASYAGYQMWLATVR